MGMQWEIEMVKTATYVFSYISAGSVAADDFQVEQFLPIGYQWLFVIIVLINSQVLAKQLT